MQVRSTTEAHALLEQLGFVGNEIQVGSHRLNVLVKYSGDQHVLTLSHGNGRLLAEQEFNTPNGLFEQYTTIAFTAVVQAWKAQCEPLPRYVNDAKRVAP